jgi:hypothetical protein
MLKREPTNLEISNVVRIEFARILTRTRTCHVVQSAISKVTRKANEA